MRNRGDIIAKTRRVVCVVSLRQPLLAMEVNDVKHCPWKHGTIMDRGGENVKAVYPVTSRSE